MKILHTVEFYSPSVGGAQEVVKHLSEHLVLLGHDVTVATTKLPNRKKKVINGVKIVEFDVGGNAVVGYTGSDVKKYQNFLLRSKFDVMMNYAAQQWATDIALEILSEIKMKKILAPCGFSGLKHPAFKNYYKRLAKLLPLYDYVVCTSFAYQDYKFVNKMKISKTKVINNGASELEFEDCSRSNKIKKKLKIDSESKLILNVSSHVYSKGHSELLSIFKKLRIKNTTLLLVSNSFDNPDCTQKCIQDAAKYNSGVFRLFDGKRIIVTSLSRDDTIQAYLGSDVFLFTSKLECAPLVLYESLAAGLPFISLPAGNAQEIAQISHGGSIGQDIKECSKLVYKLLFEKKFSQNMSLHGRKYWEKEARWDKIAFKYDQLYKKINKKK